MGKKSSRVLLSFLIAAVGMGVTIYLLVDYNLIAAVGKFTLRWAYLLWEPIAEFVVFTARLSIMRAVSSRLSWFAAGLGLRFILEQAQWQRVVAIRESVKRDARALMVWWFGKHWLFKATSIILMAFVAYRVALVHAHLILLPLGFLIEPLFRRVRNWVVSETIGGVGPIRRFYNECYRVTRVAMRRFWVVRVALSPLRAFRYFLLVHARRWHYNYRRKHGVVRGTVRMWREREHRLDQEALAVRDAKDTARRIARARVLAQQAPYIQ
jgi:hypothetical protein